MDNSVRVFALVLLAAVVSACGATDEVAVNQGQGLRPTQIKIVSGNQQSANPQEVLPQPLVVAVTTDAGVPVPGIPVDWFVTAGAGTVSQQRTHTDSEGQTSVVWTLGAQSGSQSVAASTGSISAAAGFSATASAAPVTPPAPRILVVHYDGTTVTTQYVDSTANDQLSSVWGSSASNVIALGYNGSGFELRYDGTKWTKTSGTSI